jgi:hypothetical protein
MTLVENVFKVPVNIHTLLEKLPLNELKRLE